MYAYTRREREEERILQVSEYETAFLGWVGRYLKQDPASILSEGSSIAGAAVRKIAKKLSMAAIARRKESEVSIKISTARLENGIPEPMDDRPVDDNAADDSSSSDAEVDATGKYSVDTFHGTRVVVQPCGTIKPVGRGGNILRFRMERKTAQDLMKLGTPSIYFSPEEIRLQLGNDIVYRKQIERLLASPQGPHWLIQYHHETQVIQETRARVEGKTQPPTGIQHLAAPNRPTNSVGGSQWKNGELQRKLRQGSNFECRPMKNGSNMGRVCVRGVQFLVPEEADFKSVSIQCEVNPEAIEHKYKCATNLEQGDPAYRLGVRIKFTSKIDNEEKVIWASLGGQCNTKKLNSLVDFLDGQDDEWTAQQPRRFLDRYPSKGRTKITYTS
ncbi:hypothetical protein VSDG_09308 [Cytospora chrysosperma]|uniref:Uncharacterized protein n=1 Tax=Cytospora chrysosperma TaxID=252740 RepID=A0A423VC22_CYTCH|nr:hypothetical protein VSDG_09308 [Valsa sordida]